MSERRCDQRDRWANGLVRHLRVDLDAPPSFAHVQRLDSDAHYTLVVAPRHKAGADELRAALEPQIDRFA